MDGGGGGIKGRMEVGGRRRGVDGVRRKVREFIQFTEGINLTQIFSISPRICHSTLGSDGDTVQKPQETTSRAPVQGTVHRCGQLQ